MKNNKGISLITLIVTIIVIIILAGVAIYTGYTYNIQKATSTKIYTEMNAISTAVSERGKEHRIDNEAYPYVGTALSNDSPQEVGGVSYGDGYYLVKPEELKEIGVKNVTRDYIVNYTTGEVISKEPIYMNEKVLHTFDDVIANELNAEVLQKEGEYDEEKGVNKPLVTQGMIPVKYSDADGAWVVTSEDDPEWYDYSSSTKKWANVMLQDDIELAGMTNEEVRKSNVEELVGYVVIKEGSTFVWIPRYTYKDDGGAIQVVYSRLTSDYVSNGYIKNPAFYFGEYNGATDVSPNSGYKAGGKELTGIWVSKYEAGY